MKFVVVGEPTDIPDGFEDVEPKTDRERFERMLMSGELKSANTGGTLADMGAQTRKGLVQGVGDTIAFPQLAGESLGKTANETVRSLLGFDNPDVELPRSPLDPATIGASIGNSTGIGEAETRAGKYANTISRFLPSVFMGRPGSAPAFPPPSVAALRAVPNIPSMVNATIAAGGGSEAAGQATEGSDWESAARIGGALVGGPAYGMMESLGRQPIAGLTRSAETVLKSAAPKNADVLRGLGDEAMVLDAGPSMTGLAQGVAVNPGQNADDIVNAVLAREKNRPAALKQAATDAFGRYRDPQLRKEVIGNAATRKAGPLYTAAKEGAPQLPTTLPDLARTGVRTSTNDLSMSRRAGADQWLGKIDDALQASDPSVAASRLHDLRQELDTLIVHDRHALQSLPSADKSMQSVYKDMRGTLDDILKNRLGFAEPDAIIAKGKRAQEAVDYGYDMLEGGKSAKSPQAAKVDISRGKLDPRFVKEGAAARIHNMMGTQSNDLSAIKKALGNDWNKQKLTDLYGADKTGRALREVDTRQTFSRNAADITSNSQTAKRQAAERMVNGTDAPMFSTSDTPTGLALRGGTKLASKIASMITQNMSEKNKTALSQALLKQGPDAIALIEQLNQLPAPIASALARALVVSANGQAQSSTSGR